MSQLNTQGHIQFSLKLHNSEYWDLGLLAHPTDVCVDKNTSKLISLIDMSQASGMCISGDEQYTWDKAVTTSGYTLYNAGLTEVDNGMISFDKDEIAEDEFLDIFSGTSMEVADDKVLHLCQVQDNTKQYIMESEVSGGALHLNGGFYQGFFMTECDKYQILPTDMSQPISFSFSLQRCSGITVESGITLNDTYPDNKGIFFYIGTRGEDKWWKYYYRSEIPFEKGYIVKRREESSATTKFDFLTSEGYDVRISDIVKFDTNNKYLLYHRTPQGRIASINYSGDTESFWYDNREYRDNLYLLANRTPSGYTASSIGDNLKDGSNNYYDICADLYSNALAFRIKDDGSVGFRYLIKVCNNNESTLQMVEEYSKSGLVGDNKVSLHYILKPVGEEKMRIYIYCDDNLVYVSSELPVLKLRALNQIYEKQECVPYNISLGGGTTGLGTVIYDTYKELPAYQLPLERYFAGTFIGEIYKFGIYEGEMEYEDVIDAQEFIE